MTIGVLKEPSPETRVSLLAEAVATLTREGITVLVESGAEKRLFAAMLTMKKPVRRSKAAMKYSILHRLY